MLTTLFITSLALPALVAAEALVGDGYIRHPIAARQSSRGQAKRQNEVSLANTQTGLEYLIELGIGTPPQNVLVVLDTGSTFLWVDPDCATASDAEQQAFCASLPRYDYQASSTFMDLDKRDSLPYGIGNATVEWVTDYVTAGSAKLKAQQFGVATESDAIAVGILGVAPRSDSDAPQFSYFIDSLASQGYIKSRAFSLDLQSIESPDGSIIFGGLDTGKYKGAFQKLPIIPASESPDGLTRYWVTLNTITLTSPDGSSTPISTEAVAVVLDSGNTLSRLPQAIVTALGSSFPTAQLDSSSGSYVVDCDVANSAGSVDFTFAGKTISVLYEDVIFKSGANTCILGVVPMGSESLGVAILGDTFLRSAYAVFDQDNMNIHLAQAANCGQHLVSIGSGPNAVPSVTGDCGASTSSVSSTSSTTAPPTGTTTPPPSSSKSSVPHSNSTTAPPTYMSTVYTTTVYTITSCAKTVTNCPVGHVTTEVITSLTTWCPGNTTPPPPPPPPSSTACPTETETCSTCSGGGAGGLTTSVVKPCPTCGGGSGFAPTTSALAVVTAGAGRVAAQAGAGLAVVAAAAVLL